MPKEFDRAVNELMESGVLLRLSGDGRSDVIALKFNKHKSLESVLKAINKLERYKPSKFRFYYEAGTIFDAEFGGFTKEQVDEFYRKA